MGIIKIKNQSGDEINEEKGNEYESDNEIVKSEIYTDHGTVPLEILFEVSKSICKIKIETINNKVDFGTGFFMIISNFSKKLITNYHVISQERINNDIEIEI